MHNRHGTGSLPKAAQAPTIAIFLHIPRTGGTTLRLVMEQNEELGRILPIYGPDIEHPEWVVQRLHESTRRGLKIIRGHIPYGIHQHLAWARCVYFTIVREPVARVWSLWSYAKRHRTHHLYEELNRLDTLNAALESAVSTEFNNGMCRQLSGIDGTFPQSPYAEASLPYGDDEGATKLLDTVLEHFDEQRIAVGTTEYFDDFLGMMSKFMKWPNLQHGNANQGPVRLPGVIDAHTMRTLRELNAADLCIWEYAKGVSE